MVMDEAIDMFLYSLKDSFIISYITRQTDFVEYGKRFLSVFFLLLGVSAPPAIRFHGIQELWIRTLQSYTPHPFISREVK